MTDGHLNFDTRIDTSGFSKGVRSLGGGIDSLKSKLHGIVAAASAAFGTAQLVKFTKAAVESAAEINAADSQFKQTFGSMADSAEAAIKRVSDESGIIQSRLKGVGTSIYAFAKTTGMDSASALEMTEEALKTAADSAAYYDKSLEETSETLKSFLKGNYENDAALGLSCTETTRNTAANRLFGKSFVELSESQKQLTLLQMVKEANQLSGAMGQAARESDGWENVLGNLKETWRQFTAVIGQPILKIAVSGIQRITASLESLTEKAREAVGSVMKLFGFEDEKTAEISGNTAEVSENISDSTENEKELADSIEKTEEAQKKSLASFDKLNILNQSDSAEKSNDKLSESSEKKIFQPVVTVPETDKKSVEKAVDELFEKLKRMIKPIKIAWEDNSPQLIKNAKHAAKSIKSLFSSVGKSISEVWQNGSGERLVGNILLIFGDVLGIIGDISNALKNAWDDGGRGTALVQSISDRWNSLLELIHTVADDFRNVWNNGTGEQICGKILEIFTGINNTTANIRKNLKKAWSENDTGQKIIQGILDIFNVVLGTIRNITEAAAEWAENIDFSPLLESVSELISSLEPLTGKIGEGIEWFYKNVLLPLASWTIESAVPAFLSGLSDAVDGLTAAWETAAPVLKEELWDNFLKPFAGFVADSAVKAIGEAGKAIKKVGESITAGQVKTLIEVGKAIGAVILAVKGYQIVSSFTSVISGLMSTLSTIGSSLVAALGATVTASLGTVFAAIGAFIAGWSIGTIIYDNFGEQIDAVLFPIFDFFVELWNNIVTFFTESIPEFFISIGEWFVNLYESIKGIFASVGDWFSEKFQSAKDGIINIFSDIGDWFSERWNDVKSAFSSANEWFGKKFQAAWNSITTIFLIAGKWFSERWNDIKSAFSSANEWFREKFQSAWNNITNIFSVIGEWFGERWNDIKSAFSSANEWFREKFQSAWNNVTNIFSAIGKWFSDRWNDVKSALSSADEWFREKFQYAWNNITNIFSGIGNWFSDRWNDIKSAFSSVGDWLYEKFQAAYDGVTGIWSQLGGFFGGIWDGISDGARNGVNWVIDRLNRLTWAVESALNWVVDGINSALTVDIPDEVPVIGGTHFGIDLSYVSIPEIPHLAQGTVVPANYGNFLAVLGDNKREAEIVSPMSTIEKAVRNAIKGGGTMPNEIVINTYLYPNSAAFHKEIIKIVDTEKRNRGE